MQFVFRECFTIWVCTSFSFGLSISVFSSFRLHVRFLLYNVGSFRQMLIEIKILGDSELFPNISLVEGQS